MKKVSKKYREMTQREREKLPLLERYELYFNEYRGAQIEMIGDRNGKVVVRYLDGREQELPDVLKWMDLFNELNQMHPRKQRLSPTRPDEKRRIASPDQ